MSTRTAVIVASVLAVIAASPVQGQTAKPPMLGTWQGEGEVVVPWVHQRKIPVTLTILANDSVTGKVGDAKLVSGWFTTRDPGSRTGYRWNTDYIIIANLDGPVIRTEGIWRPAVYIPLNWNGVEFVGGFATSGWRVGSIDHRTVEANLVLRAVVVAANRQRSRK